MVSIDFSDLIEVLTEKFRDIVKEELRNQHVDKNGVDTEKYLTVEQTAQFLNCSVPHVYKLKERMPHIKKGAKLYYKVEDLNNYLDSGRSVPNKLRKVA